MFFHNIELVKKGVLDGKIAYVGPEIAHISIYDFCNINCIMCWDHNPFQNPFEIYNRRKTWKILRFSTLKGLFDELQSLKTSTISLVGAGEPLLHPEIKKILIYLKSKGFNIAITTNGMLLKGELLEIIKDLPLNLKVSLHGGDFDTWKIVHPKLKRRHFNQLVKALKELSKRENISICFQNAISKANFRNVDKIIELAAEVGAREVSFHFVDIFEKIKFLKLEKEDMPVLRQSLEKGLEILKNSKIECNFESLMERTIEKEESSFSTKDFYYKNPCIIGWVYTVIISNGDVYSCCGSRYYLGNIHKESFQSIWNSENYQLFREKAKNICLSKKPIEKTPCWDCTMYNISKGYLEL